MKHTVGRIPGRKESEVHLFVFLETAKVRSGEDTSLRTQRAEGSSK